MTKVLLAIQVLLFQLSFSQAKLPDYPDPVQLGSLRAIVIKSSSTVPTIVYLHGWGGSGQQAYEQLKNEIESHPILMTKVNWIIPDAPDSGWFNIEAMDDDHMPLYNVWQKTLVPTRKALNKMIVAAKVNPQNIIWAGFSQGGITAIDYVLHSSTSSKALLVNSAIYFKSTDWKQNSPQLKGIPFFMSHDPEDNILPFSQAQWTAELLSKNGLIGGLESVSVGHEMPTGFIAKSITKLLGK